MAICILLNENKTTAKLKLDVVNANAVIEYLISNIQSGETVNVYRGVSLDNTIIDFETNESVTVNPVQLNTSLTQNNKLSFANSNGFDNVAGGNFSNLSRDGIISFIASGATPTTNIKIVIFGINKDNIIVE